MNSDVSLIIAGLSVLVAIWANRKATAASERANALQKTVIDVEEKRELLRENETKKARIRARTYLRIDTNNNHEYFLKVENCGEHAANDVRIYLDGKPLPEHNYSRSDKRSLPVLGPDAQYLFAMTYTMSGNSPLIEVKIVWNDGFSDDREYLTTVAF